jgi:hypothetical protein
MIISSFAWDSGATLIAKAQSEADVAQRKLDWDVAHFPGRLRIIGRERV